MNQFVLSTVLSDIFPAHKSFRNARKSVSIPNPLTEKYLEVDIWYPDINLCFEFQDDHHYLPTWYVHKPLERIKSKDDVKRSLLLSKSETLIYVPFWWDGSAATLQDTIAFHRPDILSCEQCNHPIPENPSRRFRPVHPHMMLASFPSDMDIADKNIWWLGEKYDGIRCAWAPAEKKLYSRHNAQLSVISSVTKLFGSIPLDGEIWCGRGLILEAQHTINAAEERINWGLFRVICFDVTSPHTQELPLESRYAVIMKSYLDTHPIVTIATRLLCSATALLTESLQHSLEGGGEGIMLCKILSLYHPGRSDDLLKIKGSISDHEALVVRTGVDGTLFLQMPDGTPFVVDKEFNLLHKRPVRGDVVTITYNYNSQSRYKHNAEVHSQPSVTRIRTDLSWGDVTTSLPVRQFLNEEYQKVDTTNVKPRGYWADSRAKTNMRVLFESVARKMGFDPLVPDNWYHVNFHGLVQQHHHVKGILRQFGSSLSETLKNLFPEMDFDVTRFRTIPRLFWQNVQNRRTFMENFAHAKGSDPLDPQFWHLLSFSERNVGKVDMNALAHLFPEMKLTKGYWEVRENRRKWLDDFANEKGFEPLSPESWYSVRIRDVAATQGGRGLLGFSSFAKTVTDAYPEITFHQRNFRSEGLTGLNVKNLRKEFESFARTRGENALDARFWYQLNPHDLIAVEGMAHIVQYFNIYYQLISRNFPELNLDRAKFKYKNGNRKNEEAQVPIAKEQDKVATKGLKTRREDKHKLKAMKKKLDRARAVTLGKSSETQRAWLTLFAQGKGRDPADSVFWYELNPIDIYKIKAKRIICSKGGHIALIVRAFPELCLDESRFKYQDAKQNKTARHKSSENVGDIQPFAAQKDNLRVDDTAKARDFFEKYAASHTFDPKVADNWYSVSMHSLSQQQGFDSLANETVIDSLLESYPHIGLQKDKFVIIQQRKRMLCDFAARCGFDPFVADSWHQLEDIHLQALKKLNMIRAYPGYIAALLDIFPDIGLSETQFNKVPAGYWKAVENRKAMFHEIAQQRGFDGRIPANWYTISVRSVSNIKGANSLISFYGGSLQRALVDTFPNIGIDEQKFRQPRAL